MSLVVTRHSFDPKNPDSMVNSAATFEVEFILYAKSVCSEAWLLPDIVRMRILEAHQFWKDDLARVDEREKKLEDGLDHFKHCGRLAYWLRRTSPVVEFLEKPGAYFTGHEELNEREEALRYLLFEHGMEYLAFDWAFQICRFYEKTRSDLSPKKGNVVLSHDYVQTICHFMKRKNVSPHALSLILLSLFQ